MSNKLNAAEYPLSKIFNSDFQFSIPGYQRPYAWELDQAKELFMDLYSFYKSGGDDGYFLGSIVLIKSEASSNAEVIDGQQRLTTLTILFSALANATHEDQAQAIRNYIIESGNWTQGLEAKPRLELRRRDATFFRKYIQDKEFRQLKGLVPIQLENEAQRNIRANALYFMDEIGKYFSDDKTNLQGFVQFLTTRCFLVAVTTPNRESAYRVFSVMNSRGLELQATDIIKADYTGSMSDDDAEELTQEWEQIESDLGREGFNELFSHIRMIRNKEKARRSLLEDFRKIILPVFPDPKKFIGEVLNSHAKAFQILKYENYESVKYAEEVNKFLAWLNRLEFSDWIPPALIFLVKKENNP
ncbi:MAG: DUF262 domain-containing protein, partial [Maribacter dokdonensis]|uniref:DUF262 domain-containing protein n=1 Tax=Maribacter dokdonensis TaxID=320912 RepID=UPI00329821A2